MAHGIIAILFQQPTNIVFSSALEAEVTSKCKDPERDSHLPWLCWVPQPLQDCKDRTFDPWLCYPSFKSAYTRWLKHVTVTLRFAQNHWVSGMIMVFTTFVVVACATYEHTVLLQERKFSTLEQSMGQDDESEDLAQTVEESVLPNKHHFFVHDTFQNVQEISWWLMRRTLFPRHPLWKIGNAAWQTGSWLVIMRFWPLCCGVL